MNAILVIKKEHGMNGDSMNHFDHAAMQNTVGICDCVLTDKSDGDQVSATIKGTLIEQDGKRFISIDEVDGHTVEDMEIPMHDNHEKESEDTSAMDSEDALNNFMKQYKGNK